MNRIYEFCRSCVGSPIWVRTLNGRLYKGNVRRVTHETLYLEPLGHGVALDSKTIKGKNLLSSTEDTKDAEEIYLGLIGLPFLGIGAAGFLGGLVGGFVGARAGLPRRGFRPGYGYGYPGPY
jgi:hypothetical protein